jgi:hypothetical protein
MIICLVIQYEFSFDSFHPGKERIYRIGAKVQEDNGNQSMSADYSEGVPPPVPAMLKENISGIEAVAGFYPYGVKITIPQNDRKSRDFTSTIDGTNMAGTIITGPDYFSIFSYDWLAGNQASSLAQPFSVVLSESRARKYFGPLLPEKMLGKELIYDDSLRVHVSGIVKDWEGNTDFPYTDFISFSTIGSSFLKRTYNSDSWHFTPGIPWICGFVKLARGKDPIIVNSQVTGLAGQHIKTDAFLRLIHFSLQLQPLPDIHFNSNYGHDGIRKAHLPTLYALMGIAAFILCIAVINFINLSTAQAIGRSKETGVRKVLGSSRSQLILLFLTETATLTLFAACIATLMTRPLLSVFSDFIPPGMEFHIGRPFTLLLIGSVTVATSLLAGLYPALVLSSSPPVLSLKGMPEDKNIGHWNLRKALIVFQFTVSLIFIIGSVVIREQLKFMRDADFGFTPDAIITIDKGNITNRQLKVFGEKVQRLPGVDRYVLQGHPPMGDARMEFPIKYEGANIRELMVSILAGGKGFIPFYQMKLLAGRNLANSDSLSEYVINETYSRALGFNTPGEAIGKLLYWKNKSYPIVGVVADFHEGSFHQAIPALLIGHMPEFENSMGVRLKTSGQHTGIGEVSLSQIERLWKSTFPGEPFNYRFLDESIAQLYQTDRQVAWLMTVAMTVTIFMCCMGLLGLTLFIAEKRKKEISIRKVLGAGVADIIALLNRDFVMLISIALVIAIPIAWYGMNRWLQDFAYRIRIGWGVFAVSGICLILIVLLSTSYQVIRAAAANPIKNLRSE